MEATTPTGSRRIIEVCPSRYSPAAIPGRQRAAPAKKRKTSAMAGISSLITQCSGLPQFSDSSCAVVSACAEMASASFRRHSARVFGVV